MKKNILLATSLMFASAAYSATDCTKDIDRVYVGDGGDVYILYVGGGHARVPATNPDQENALSIAMAALMGGKQVTVRYNGDNISCTAEVDDFRGIYLKR